MTTAMEVKLLCKLCQVKDLMTVMDITSPKFPDSCEDLISALEARNISPSLIASAEQSLALVYGDFLNGSVRAVFTDSFAIDYVGRIISIVLDLLRTAKQVSNGYISESISIPELKEAFLWNNISTTHREIYRKWHLLYGWNVLDPAAFASSFPAAWSKLTPKERDFLLSNALPTSPIEFSSGFRYLSSKGKAQMISISQNIQRLQKCCSVYDYLGIAWKYFYGQTFDKVPIKVGLSIAADINKLVSLYMEYRAFIFSICMK